MPNLNASFGGQTLILPGVYYQDNVSNAFVPTPPTTPPLLFIGYGWGGAPNTAYSFSDLNDLANFLRGGPAAAFVPFLATPSTAVNGAQLVTFINASENTQSHATLNNGAASGVIALTSANYGPPSNLLKFSVASGAIANSVNMALADDFAASQNLAGTTAVTASGLGLPFKAAYTGAASGGASLVITGSGAANVALVTVSGTVAGQIFSYPVTSATTIDQVVQFINGTGFYVAQTLTFGAELASGLTNTATGAPWTTTYALAAVSGGIYQYSYISAALNDILFWLNNRTGGLVTASITAGTASSNVNLPTVYPFTYLSGAVGVPPTNNDYASALNVGLTVPAWTLFMDSNASGVMALGAQHVLTASSIPYGRPRRYFTGSSLSDSVTTTIQNAQNLNAKEVTYLYPGIQRTNIQTNLPQLYSGLYTAACAAAMATGNIIAMPLTNKSLFATGVEALLTISQIDQLQQNGVMIVQPANINVGGASSVQPGANGTGGIPTIISDFTTWQVNGNPENVFNQQVACRQWLEYSMQNALKPYVGTIADPVDELRILNAAKAMLNALIYKQGNNGVLSSWDPTTLQLVYSGTNQLAAVSVNVTFVGQNRFITVTVDVQPLNFTITATAA